MQSGGAVVQRYISKPLLLNGFKFDLRLYVIVCGFDPMNAFLADEGLARFCTVSNFAKGSNLIILIGEILSTDSGEFPQSLHAPYELLH